MGQGVRSELATRRKRVTAEYAVVALAVVPLAGCSSPLDTQGARVLHVTIDSRFVHGAMPSVVIRPPFGRRSATSACRVRAPSTTPATSPATT
jgi:hypothetical protein